MENVDRSVFIYSFGNEYTTLRKIPFKKANHTHELIQKNLLRVSPIGMYFSTFGSVTAFFDLNRTKGSSA